MFSNVQTKEMNVQKISGGGGGDNKQSIDSLLSDKELSKDLSISDKELSISDKELSKSILDLSLNNNEESIEEILKLPNELWGNEEMRTILTDARVV